MKARIGEKRVIGDFECHRLQSFQIDGEKVTGVNFSQGRNQLLLCLTEASDVQRFEKGAKYKLTLERV